jgi:hypothetical protein
MSRGTLHTGQYPARVRLDTGEQAHHFRCSRERNSSVAWDTAHHHTSGLEDEQGLCSMCAPVSHHCAEAEAYADMSNFAAAV